MPGWRNLVCIRETVLILLPSIFSAIAFTFGRGSRRGLLKNRMYTNISNQEDLNP